MKQRKTITSSHKELIEPAGLRPHKVIFLGASGPFHRNSCATLIKNDVNVVAAVFCNREGFKEKLKFLRSWAKRYGVFKTVEQIIGRILDKLKNSAFEKEVLTRLISDENNKQILKDSGVPLLHTDSYIRPDILQKIKELQPDIFVVHSKYMVSKKITELASVTTIGGHPGITPYYRGAYSPFWAIMQNELDMVGCTAFILDEGIDTGAVIAQTQLDVTDNADSHLTLAWKGMIEIAELQSEAIKTLDNGEALPVYPNQTIPENSYFGPPGLFDILKYRRMQSKVR